MPLCAIVPGNNPQKPNYYSDIGFNTSITKPVLFTDLVQCFHVVNKAALTGSHPEHISRADSISKCLAKINHSARILLVEDILINQKVASGFLNNMGLKCDVAANGAEALKALENTSYDLVLMDMQMPIMDGVEATRHIRSSTSAVLNHRIPIVAMTANAQESDQQQCFDAGMDDFTTKPIVYKTLLATLLKWLPGTAITKH